MPIDLVIFVGTMTETARLTAQSVEMTLSDDADVHVEIQMMDGLDARALADLPLVLICTSTYGQGDVPDNARQLYQSLSTTRPNLSGLRYGVIALGDRTYAETFCNGGKRFDAILSELGAQRIGDVMLHDASAGTMPEEVAGEWVVGWMELCRSRDRG